MKGILALQWKGDYLQLFLSALLSRPDLLSNQIIHFAASMAYTYSMESISSLGFSSCGSINGPIVQYIFEPRLLAGSLQVIESTKLCQAHLLELYFLWNYSEWNRSSIFMLGKLFSSCGYQNGGGKPIMEEGCIVLYRWSPKGTFINNRKKQTATWMSLNDGRRRPLSHVKSQGSEGQTEQINP